MDVKLKMRSKIKKARNPNKNEASKTKLETEAKRKGNENATEYKKHEPKQIDFVPMVDVSVKNKGQTFHRSKNEDSLVEKRCGIKSGEDRNSNENDASETKLEADVKRPGNGNVSEFKNKKSKVKPRTYPVAQCYSKNTEQTFHRSKTKDSAAKGCAGKSGGNPNKNCASESKLETKVKRQADPQTHPPVAKSQSQNEKPTCRSKNKASPSAKTFGSKSGEDRNPDEGFPNGEQQQQKGLKRQNAEPQRKNTGSAQALTCDSKLPTERIRKQASSDRGFDVDQEDEEDPKYRKRAIQSNWGRYELEEESSSNSENESLDSQDVHEASLDPHSSQQRAGRTSADPCATFDVSTSSPNLSTNYQQMRNHILNVPATAKHNLDVDFYFHDPVHSRLEEELSTIMFEVLKSVDQRPFNDVMIPIIPQENFPPPDAYQLPKVPAITKESIDDWLN